MSTAVIVCLVMAIILLFAVMVLSAMSASDAQKRNTVDAHRYAQWAAITSGISIALIIAILVIYVYYGYSTTGSK